MSRVASQAGSQRKSKTVIHTGSQSSPSNSVGVCFGITVNKSYVSGLLRKAPFDVRLRGTNKANESVLAGEDVIIHFERHVRRWLVWQPKFFSSIIRFITSESVRLIIQCYDCQPHFNSCARVETDSPTMNCLYAIMVAYSYRISKPYMT